MNTRETDKANPVTETSLCHGGQPDPAKPANRIQFSDKPHGRISTVLNRLSIHLSTLVLLGVAVIASLAPAPAAAQTSTVNICDRTPRVEAAILARISPRPACEAVPEADLARITSLFLFSAGITSLASDDFAGLAALESLSLENNTLTTLPDGVFDNLAALESLGLGNNALTTLPAGIFDGLTALEQLSLDRNNLTTLPDGVFDNLAALTFLTLARNDLTTLPDGVFDSLAALEALGLFFNDLTTLPDGVFDNLAALEELRLFRNDLTTLPDGVFDNLAALETLLLSSNNFSTLPDGVFDGLSALVMLDLNRNDLTTLPDGVFDGLSALVMLDLNRNDLTTLPDRVFNSLSALVTLDLSDNNALTTLPDGVFDNLATLERLDLRFNAFTTLPDGIFDSLSALERLSLRSNLSLTTLPPDIFDNLSALEYLDLTGNNFTTLPIGVFDEVLDTLGPINPDFTDFNPSSSFDFFNHGDSSFDTDIVAALLVDDRTRSAHFVCSRTYVGAIVDATDGVDDCLLITAAQFNAAVQNAGPAVNICERTPQVEAAILAAILDPPPAILDPPLACDAVPEAFLATINTLDLASADITSLASGDFMGLSALETLDLDGNALTTLPDGVFDGLSALPRLDLSGQGLTTLPDGVFDNLSALERLNLRNNDLTTLPDGVFDNLAALESLSLFDNALTTLPDGVFDNLSALESLSLSNNLLTTLPNGVFDSLAALGQLDLSSNLLTTLPNGVFDNLAALESLNLTGNALTTLPDGVFDNLAALVGLSLYHNALTTLPDGVFDNLAALESLNLGGNSRFRSRLSRLPDGVFDNLAALVGLSLYHNALTTLPDGVFDNLAALESLNLGGNSRFRSRLSRLPDGVFDNLAALTFLDLSGNDLTTLSDGVFDNLAALVTLDLNFNDFTTLPTDVFDDILDTLNNFTASASVSDNVRRAYPACSLQANADTIVAATAGVDDCLRITSAQLSTVVSNAGLSALMISEGTLTPAFDSGAFIFSATVPFAVTNLAITPTTADSGATVAVTVNGGAVMTTPPFTAALDVGANAIEVVVTAADSTSLTYMLTVTRNPVSVNICDRIPEVQAAILGRISPRPACETVLERDLAGITSLDLSEAGITSLTSDDFTGLSALESLGLGGNALTTLPDGVFDSLSALEWLVLDDNALTTLPDGVFDSLSALERLNLDDNALTTLPDGVFDSLSALEWLNLDDNALTTLPDGVFDNLSALTFLDLERNALTTLPDGVFDNLSALTFLDLERNALTTLPDSIFDSLSALTSLDLGGNALTTLPDSIFDSLSALTSLDLGGNDFTTLPDSIFDGLAALEFLRLSNNDALTTLPDSIFDSLSALTSLDLGGNDFTTLPDGVFDHLSALTFLDLSSNDFTTLPDGVFDNLAALETLDLRFNDLTTLPDGVFDSLALAALERLDLTGNALTTLPEGAFDSLSALEGLSLRFNDLTTLPEGVFDSLSALKYLDLRSSLSMRLSLPVGVFDDVLDTLGPINPDLSSLSFDPLFSAAFLVDDRTRRAHFVCSRADAATIVAATAGVDDCLRITSAQLAAARPNAGLSALTISEGTLTPVFDRGTFTYSATVPNAVTSLTITPTVAENGLTVAVTVNGGAAMTTGPFTAALDVGENTIEIVVTAADSSTLTYSLTVTRDEAPTVPTVVEPQLGLQGNMLTVTDTAAGFEQTVAIGSTGENNGVIAPIVNVPNFGPLSMPTFSFGLDRAGEFAYTLGTGTPTVSSSRYRFRAGMVIDEPGSMRRLELDIPIVNMDIGSDGTLTGTIPPQDFNVWGRSADGQTVAAASLPINTSISFNDNTFQFDADVFIERIQSGGGLLTGVRNVINTIEARGATFDYSLVLKQVKDPANSEEPDIAFGSDPGASFVAFPTVADDATEAEGFAGFEQLRDATGNPTTQSPFNALYGDGYRLSGQVSFIAASTGPVVPGPTDPDPTDPDPTDPDPTDPDPTDPDPTDPGPTDPGPTDPGGEGGATIPPPVLPDNAVTANDQLTEAITGIDLSQIPDDGVIDPDMVASINNVLEDAGALADLVSAELDSGDISASESIDSLATLSDAAALAGAAIQAGAEIETATVTGIINGIADVIDVLDDTTLSPALMNAVQATAQSTLAAVADLVADDAEPAATEAILDSASALVNAVVVLDPDTALTEGFKAIAQSLAESVLRKALDDIAAGLGQGDDVTFTDSASTQALLAENPTLLDEVLEVSAISLTGTTPLDATATQSAIEEAGVSAAGAEALTADLNQFVIPTGVAIEIDDQANDVVALLNDVLLDAGITAAADSTIGSIEFAFDSGAIEAFVTDVAIVPDSVPEGVFIKPDGSAVIIEDGVAISVAPSPAELIEFVAAIESVGEGEYTTTIRDNGILALTHTPSGDAFNATFSFEVIGSGEPVAMTDFDPPEGNDPADPEYKFEVTFEDGSTQFLLPMMAAPQFYDSMTAMGFEMETDRSTGVISIDNGSRFRADYISWPATSFEILFLNGNADEFGVAYIPTDANGDGIEDFIVITRINGVATAQVVYRLP